MDAGLMTTESRYIQFPLFLMRGLVTNKNHTISDMLRYGIYNYSKKLPYENTDVARQICYDNYNNNLSSDVLKVIKPLKLVLFGSDQEYRGFIKNEFFPIEEISELEEAFKGSPRLKELSVEHYRVHIAMQSLKIAGNIKSIIEDAKRIDLDKPEHEPMPMVNVSLLFNIRDKEKSENELMQFAAFIAIKSIIGRRPFAKTNKMHIVSRMFGYASHKHLPDKPDPLIKAVFNKYSNRYHIDRLLVELELHWQVITYSNNIRGLYVAISDKITLQALALECETRKKKNQIENLKNEKLNAKNYALQQLKRPQLNKEKKG